jgi:cyclohexanone monooxygenase
VIGNMINACEQHVDWLADCIDHMRKRGSRILEAEPAAERAWMTHVAEMAERTLFPKADSWYLGANIAGKPASSCPMSAKATGSNARRSPRAATKVFV